MPELCIHKHRKTSKHKRITVRNKLAMAKGFITLRFSHNGLAFELVCNLIVAASNEQVRIREPTHIQHHLSISIKQLKNQAEIVN